MEVPMMLNDLSREQALNLLPLALSLSGEDGSLDVPSLLLRSEKKSFLKEQGGDHDIG
jgi:hypothetical protein